MSNIKIMTLKQAGLPYPDMHLLKHIKLLLGNIGHPFAVYGGFLRDSVLLGHTDATKDIDIMLTNEGFLALKPPYGREDVRRHFSLYDPHLLHMLHLHKEKKLADADKPFVLVLKPQFKPYWYTTKDIGITILEHNFHPFDVFNDTDLGFCDIVSDGEEVWITEAFYNDMVDKTLTLRRKLDPRNFERTRTRVERFTAPGGRYEGWEFIIPDNLKPQD